MDRLGPQANFAADEPEAAVANQRAWQQPGFHQDLKAVTEAHHQSPCRREFADRAHHRRKPGDGPAAEIIAVREAARQNDRIYVAQTRRIVPDIFRFLAEVGGDSVESVVVAIASGKNNDAKFHEFCFGKTKFYFGTEPRASASGLPATAKNQSEPRPEGSAFPAPPRAPRSPRRRPGRLPA